MYLRPRALRSFSRWTLATPPKPSSHCLKPFSFGTTSIRWMNTADDSGVIVTDHGRVKHVLLNRPKALNALDLPMVRKLIPLYKEWEKKPDTIVVMRGAGDKAFCAGGDIRSIYDSGKSGGTLQRDFFREEYILNYAIAKQSFAHVALLNGITMGGGVGLSVHGKYRVATENTVFAMPETGIGFFCDVGGSYFLSRLEGIGMYLALTGARLKGKELLVVGVATHFIEAAKLDQFEQALLKTTNLESTIKEYTVSDRSPSQVPSSEVVEFRDTIEQTFALQNSIDQILANLQTIAKRKENEKTASWAKKTLETISKMSPTSLKVVHKQLREGRKLNYPDIFKMEYRISQAFMRGTNSDFFEGVRAVLVDKDKNPKWNPPSLDQVSDKALNSFFEPVENDLILEPSQPSKL